MEATSMICDSDVDNFNQTERNETGNYNFYKLLESTKSFNHEICMSIE
jgi:hypothetical protein